MRKASDDRRARASTSSSPASTRHRAKDRIGGLRQPSSSNQIRTPGAASAALVQEDGMVWVVAFVTRGDQAGGGDVDGLGQELVTVHPFGGGRRRWPVGGWWLVFGRSIGGLSRDGCRRRKGTSGRT